MSRIRLPRAEDARTRILVSGLTTSLANRVVSAIVPLLLIPIALKELGATAYGAWAAAQALTGLLVLADFGIGSGLMTRLGGSDPGNDRQSATKQPTFSAEELVSSAYFLAGVFAATSFGIIAAAAVQHDLAALVAAPGNNLVEAALVLTFGSVAINIVLTLVTRVQYAVGEQGRSNIWQAVGALSMLASGIAASVLDAPPVVFLILVSTAPLAVTVINSLHVFAISRTTSFLRPRARYVGSAACRDLVGIGGQYFVVSVLMALSLALDPWIVARAASLEEVADFSIPYRIFVTIGSVGVMIAIPLWPLHARAVASGDVEWIRRVTRRMTATSGLVIGVAATIAVASGPWLLDFWLDDQVRFEPRLWSGFAVWVTLQALTGPMFMVQNGAALLRPQMYGYCAVVVALPLKWVVADRIGFEWLSWSSAVFYGVFVVPACLVGYAISLRATRRNVV